MKFYYDVQLFANTPLTVLSSDSPGDISPLLLLHRYPPTPFLVQRYFCSCAPFSLVYFSPFFFYSLIKNAAPVHTWYYPQLHCTPDAVKNVCMRNLYGLEMTANKDPNGHTGKCHQNPESNASPQLPFDKITDRLMATRRNYFFPPRGNQTHSLLLSSPPNSVFTSCLSRRYPCGRRMYANTSDCAGLGRTCT